MKSEDVINELPPWDVWMQVFVAIVIVFQIALHAVTWTLEPSVMRAILCGHSMILASLTVRMEHHETPGRGPRSAH